MKHASTALLTLLGLLIVASPNVSVANSKMTGQGLLIVCMSEKLAHDAGKSPFDEAFCHGFIQGVHDAWAHDRFCPADDVSRHVLADHVMRALTANPGYRIGPAVAVVAAILKEKLPCN